MKGRKRRSAWQSMIIKQFLLPTNVSFILFRLPQPKPWHVARYVGPTIRITCSGMAIDAAWPDTFQMLPPSPEASDLETKRTEVNRSLGDV